MKLLYLGILVFFLQFIWGDVAYSQDFTIETSSGGNTLDFGKFITIGDTATGWFKITNIGNRKANYSMYSGATYEPDQDLFVVNGIDTDRADFSLAPNEIKKFIVRFVPKEYNELDREEFRWGRTERPLRIFNDTGKLYYLPVVHRISPLLSLKTSEVQYLYLLDIVPNTTICAPLYIKNETAYPVIINKPSFPITQTITFSEDDSYPIVLAPGEKIAYMTTCFIPPTYNLKSGAELTTNFTVNNVDKFSITKVLGYSSKISTVVKQKRFTPIDISISPNPSTGEVFISTTGVKSSTIEIFDVLGNRVREQRGNECHWSAINTGTYFARVTGYSEDGEPFVESKRILITR